jgi:hypothetical protein
MSQSIAYFILYVSESYLSRVVCHLLAYRDATAICEFAAPLPLLGFLGMRNILGTKCRVPLGVEMR